MRRTIFIQFSYPIYSSNINNITNRQIPSLLNHSKYKKFFSGFYHISLEDEFKIDQLKLEKFDQTLQNPSPEFLVSVLTPECLILAFDNSHLMYIGVFKDIVRRKTPIRLPGKFDQKMIESCVYQTSNSPILFK